MSLLRRWREAVAAGVVAAAAVIVLGFLAVVAGAAFDARTAAENAETSGADSLEETLTNRQIGYQRGSIDCLGLVVDDDRTWPLWYPVEVCPLLVERPPDCGSRADDTGPE